MIGMTNEQEKWLDQNSEFIVNDDMVSYDKVAGFLAQENARVNQLKAQVERLRDELSKIMKNGVYCENGDFLNVIDKESVNKALQESAAHSLAKHDAELLRSIAEEWANPNDTKLEGFLEDVLIAKADELEKEASK